MRLRPAEVAGTLFLFGMAMLCVRLGFWQLDRLEQRRDRNAALVAATARPPVALDAAAFDAASRDPASLVNRRAHGAGTYLPGDFVLRGRSQDGSPGVHVATPLAVDGGVVMVLRGFLPSPDASTLDSVPAPPPGRVTVSGLLQAVPVTDDRGQPSGGSGGRALTHRRLDLGEVRERFPDRPVLPLYLQLLPGSGASAAAISPVPAPVPHEGNHLSYAVQWFGFATIAVAGWTVLFLRRRRPSAS